MSKSAEFFMELQIIGNNAVREAQEENRLLGVPNVYANEKGLYFELPDGTITTENPFTKKSS